MSWFKDAYKWLKKVSGSGDTVADQVNNELPSDFGSGNTWNSGESKAQSDSLQGGFTPLDFGYWSLVFTQIISGVNFDSFGKKNSQGADSSVLMYVGLGVGALLLWLFLSDDK